MADARTNVLRQLPASRRTKAGSSAGPDILRSAAFLAVIALVSLGPVLYVLVMSFDATGTVPGWSLDAWREVFKSRNVGAAIGTSFLLSLRVPAGVVIAFLAAWLLVRVQVPGRRFLEMSLWFGFFMPSVPIIMGWVLLLDENFGLVNDLLLRWGLFDKPIFAIHSFAGIMWAHISANTIPILIILLAPAFRQIDVALEEAAIVSGASRSMVIRKIILPIMAPAILVAFTAAFIKSLESFEIEQILGVPAGIGVYSTKIFEVIADDPPQFPLAMALSSVFLIVLVMLLVLYRGVFSHKAERPSFTGRDSFRTTLHSPWLKWGGAALLTGFVIIGIYLPFTALVVGSFMRLFGFFGLPDPWTTGHWSAVLTDPQFFRATANSIMLGLVAGTLGACLFAAIGWALIRSRLRWRAVAGFLVWLPWAIPGIVLGVFFLDLTLNAPVISAFHGTMVPVVLALLIKELPIGVQMMRVAVAQVPKSMEEAAVVSGARRIRTFFRITLPLISPALLAVFLLVFAATVRDISTLVLIAPPGLQTLSLVMFSYANISEFESAAVIGTIVALISLALAAGANRFSSRAGIAR